MTRIEGRPEGDLRGVVRRSAYKPRSVRIRAAVYSGAFIPRAHPWTIIYLGLTLPRGSCGLPGARRGRAAPRPCGLRSCLALLQVGVAWPRSSLTAPVVSCTTFSPLPMSWTSSRRRESHRPESGMGGCFLWPCPRVTPPGHYPAPRSMERGLSSEGRYLLRSSGQPASWPSYRPPRAPSTRSRFRQEVNSDLHPM